MYAIIEYTYKFTIGFLTNNYITLFNLNNIL